MDKKIKVTDLAMDFNTGTILYVTIDTFRFSADKELFDLKVEIENRGVFELVEEVDLNLIEEIIVNHDDIKRFSLNWIFNNVEIVSEI